jgi:hypothetical protein
VAAKLHNLNHIEVGKMLSGSNNKKTLTPGLRSPGAYLPAGHAVHCPGRNPPFLAAQHPARPSKSATQTRFTVGSAKGAEPPPAGPGP